MTHSLLRSGCPDDFLALGENGQAVFDSAWQIRETLRLRKQQTVADALAIPQINESGDRIDWYAPHAGHVTSWAAASEEQRTSALRYLEHCLSQVHLLSTQCLRSEKTSLRLFGSLLAKTLQFPASQYIYLVDNKPVITFWGFVNQNEAAREDILACLPLHIAREASAIPSSRPVEPVVLKPQASEDDVIQPPAVQADEIAAVYSLKAEPDVAPTATADAPVRQRRHWIPTVIVLMLLIAMAAHHYLLPETPAEEEIVATTAMIDPVVVPPNPPTPAVEFAPTTLPLMVATVALPEAVEAVTPTEADIPPGKELFVMPADELKKGSTHFLNGSWLVRAQFSDPIAGKPPTLRYQIRQNKGTVRLLNSDNIACKAEVFSGLHQSGTLMIKNRSYARCDDGSRHLLPEISCKAGINGIAECTGRYEGDNLVPVTFQKVSN